MKNFKWPYIKSRVGIHESGSEDAWCVVACASLKNVPTYDRLPQHRLIPYRQFISVPEHL